MLVQAGSETEMKETAEARLKRMAMRSWRRGTKEMDLVLGPWADAHLAGLDAERLRVYDLLLEENDQDLMAFILGQAEPPAAIAGLLAEIASFARGRLAAKA
jgi:antitoxin CptB